MPDHWLLKQEPTAYSFSRLEREQETEWNGVHNALALRYLRSVAVGDLAFFYHSGSERACVGIMRVVRGPQPDPDDARGSWTVRVRSVRPLKRPVTLAELRADPAVQGLELLRFSRLSVMPVSAEHWARIVKLSETPTAGAAVKAVRSGRARANGPRPRGTSARRTR